VVSDVLGKYLPLPVPFPLISQRRHRVKVNRLTSSPQGQWITAFAPSFTVISNILPFFLVMFALFNGVVRPYAQLPVFWRYWMYYVNPSTYWIGGVLAATLKDIPVRCAESETAGFNPPPGQTCAEYAGDFAARVGGYLLDPNANQNCMYCAYSSGDQFLASLNIRREDKWRDFGIFLAFCVSNIFLVYFFVYTVRVKGWSFGFGTVFGIAGKAVDWVEGFFRRNKKKDASEE
jgi:ATP-binding cassette, subfamily G (WHITE), member 2, SNQ2